MLLLSHLSIYEQQQLICNEKVFFMKKMCWKIHLLFCRNCRFELISNNENIKMISQLRKRYVTHANNSKSNGNG